METKGRRSLRSSGPTRGRTGPAKPVEAPPLVNGPKEAEPSKLAEPPVEFGQASETALELVAAAATMIPPPSVAPLQPATSAKASGSGSFDHSGAAALAQSQAALTRCLEALSAEMAGLALSGMNELARTATKLLAVKTLSDAIEVNAGFTCSSFEAVVTGSAKLSELGVKLAAETSQPLLSQFGKGWSKAARPGG